MLKNKLKIALMIGSVFTILALGASVKYNITQAYTNKELTRQLESEKAKAEVKDAAISRLNKEKLALSNARIASTQIRDQLIREDKDVKEHVAIIIPCALRVPKCISND